MYSKREQLIQDGFCVFENVLTPEMVRRTNAASNRLLDAQDATRKIAPLMPIYEGDCEELEWNRIPGPALV